MTRETDREQKLVEYLERIRNADFITSEIQDTALAAWRRVNAATGHTCPVPNAGPGPNGELLFTWDTKEHHLELEISPTEPPYFFYTNRVTNEIWGEHNGQEEPVPAVVVEYLRLVTDEVQRQHGSG